MWKFIKSNIIPLILLLLVCLPLRFVNLGYSEFIPDEKKTVIVTTPRENFTDLLLKQRKGPMQFLVAEIPRRIVGNRRNELAQRMPFTITNCMSVVSVYVLVLLITKNKLAALMVSVIYSVNGFIVGFGRIAQYQSLNMLFSLTSLIFLYYLAKSKTKLKTYAFITGLLTALSFLSHWDALFYMPLALYFIVKFIMRDDVEKLEKIKILATGLVSFLIPFLLFFIPYISNITSTDLGHSEYFGKRIGAEGSSLKEHFEIFSLYHPFVAAYFYLVGFVLSLFFVKKTWPFVMWFLINLALLRFFMVTPKTHIYNYLIPLVFCCGLGYYYLLRFMFTKSRFLTILLTTATFLVTFFLFYQSYMLFVDHEPEYPWFQKKVWIFETEEFYFDQVITFGFPYYRGWREANDYIPLHCKFITNENKSIAQHYLDAKYGVDEECNYTIVVKGTFDLEGNNVIYANLKESRKVFQYRNSEKTILKVYRMK